MLYSEQVIIHERLDDVFDNGFRRDRDSLTLAIDTQQAHNVSTGIRSTGIKGNIKITLMVIEAIGLATAAYGFIVGLFNMF